VRPPEPIDAPRLLAALSLVAISVLACESEREVPALDKGAVAKPARMSHHVTDALRCPADTWPVYAHGATRSGASRGCCDGPLQPLWRFSPPPSPPRKARVFHAVATGDAVLASGVIGESPSVFAVSFAGERLWTFDSHVDITLHVWPSFVLDRVVLNDDGFYIIDPRTGEQEVDRGMDSWGQVITDGKNLFATNIWYVAGPKTYVGALEVGGAPLWKRNEYGVTKEDVKDRLGGIALAGDRVFFTPNYTPSPGAGVFAYDTAGERQWNVETVPKSHVAVAGETLYGFERRPGASTDELVARSTETGKLRWATHAASPESTAPVVTHGLVVYRDEGGAVVAVRRTDGTEAWRTALSPPLDTDVGWSTSLAAAAGSGTLVAVDGKQLVVLSLRDGQLRHRGRPASGPVHSPVIAAGKVYVTEGDALAAYACAPP